jgi:branched-chain amino acid transport system substrate-binding protein
VRNLILCAAAWLAAVSCGGPGGAADEIVLGEYGSMTGSEANFGQSTHDGIVMAVDELNARGGVLGKKVRLVHYDDQGKTSEVGTAVTRLITADRALAVLGEVSSSLSIAGGQIAQQHGVPMVTPSSTNPKVTETGEFVFRVCFTDSFQGYAMARFATDPPAQHGLGVRRVAMLIDQRQAYAQGLGLYFSDALGKLGGAVVATESYQGGDQDYSAQLTRIRAARPEAVYIPGYYTDVANIAKQARALGIAVPLLGGDGWESVAEMGVEALEGSFYSNHYADDEARPEVRAFVDKYRHKHGRVPDSLAALGYDAVMLLADALLRAAPAEALTARRRALRDALAATKDFRGVTGTVAIDAGRNARKPAVILRITGKAVKSAASIEPPGEDWQPPASAPPAEDEPAPQADPGGSSLLQFVLKGISIGSLYALIALGYTMVYGILAFINFAHSDVFMLGAFFSWRFAKAFELMKPSPLAAAGLLLLAMAGCALTGFLIERLAYRPLRSAPRINVLITAIGVSLFIENAGQLVFGKSVVRFPQLTEHVFQVGGIQVRTVEVIAVLAALVLMGGLQYLVFGTRVGKAMRAVAVDHKVAGLMGIPVDRVIAFTFVLGSALAGAAGLLVGVTYGQIKQPADASWILYGLKAFVAAVIGGIGNLPGAMLGGLLLGLSEQLVAGYLSTTFRDAIAFALLILILLFRPAGLLGRQAVEKV